MSESPTPERPLLRVVRGNPTDVELAALTAIVAAASSAKVTKAASPRRSWWGDYAAALRHPHHPGDGAWRASGLPN